MNYVYTLGSDDGLFPQVQLMLLSSYLCGGDSYTDLTLSQDGYETLKEHFRKVIAEEQIGK